MPQFKIAKTSNISKLNNKEFNEDKLYIYKETDKIGRLFYDFKNGARIEIGSNDNVYKCLKNEINEGEPVSITQLQKYLTTNELSTVNIDEIQINSLVTTDKSLYNIRDIDRNKQTVILRKIYTQQDLKWNNFY